MSWEQRNADFCKAQTDAQMAYIEAEREVDRLQAENAKLRELVAQRTARRVIVSNADTDHATGHCECGACGGAIDFWDAWCRHCGTKLEEDA